MNFIFVVWWTLNFSKQRQKLKANLCFKKCELLIKQYSHRLFRLLVLFLFSQLKYLSFANNELDCSVDFQIRLLTIIYVVHFHPVGILVIPIFYNISSTIYFFYHLFLIYSLICFVFLILVLF